MTDQYCEFRQQEHILICTLADNLLALHGIEAMQKEWQQWIDEREPQHVIIDMQHVQACGSDAINALLRVSSRLKDEGRDLSLCGMTPRVREVFQLSRLIGTVFTVHANLDDALAAID